MTALAASSLDDLGTLATALAADPAQFSNATGLTTIAVSDSTVDAITLATRIDSYDAVNEGATTDSDSSLSGATVLLLMLMQMKLLICSLT